MASEKPKRDIAHFFRPYAKPDPSKTIPAKRPSPIPGDDLEESTRFTDKQSKWTEPRTPHTASRVRKATLSPWKSPLGPRSGTSVTIPIRSPKFSLPQNSLEPLAPNASAIRKGVLFTSSSKENGGEKKPLSFADISTSGQSVVKDGKLVAVKSSDDEDSDSLCSLDALLGGNRHEVATGSSSLLDVDEEDLEAQRARSLRIFTNGRSNALVGRDKLRELTSKSKGLNFDISSLVGDHFDDEETEANVTKAKEGYKASNDQEQFDQQSVIDKNLIASAVGQDEGSKNFQKLLNAVERTDALATEYTWSMFDSKQQRTDSSATQPFPRKVVESDLRLESLEDPTSRSRAYLSGYIAEKAGEGILPEKLITWAFKSIATELRDDLRACLVQATKAASNKWTRKRLTPSLVEHTFCQLGADPALVKCASEIKPVAKGPPYENAPLHTQLLSSVQTLVGLSVDMIPETLSKFVKLLTRLAIDTHLMSNSRTCVVVEDAISSLLGHDEELVSKAAAQCILQDIGLRVKDPFLQTLALKHILPASSAGACLRIRLANIFLLGPSKESTVAYSLSNPDINLQRLTTHLQDPRYDISRSNRQGTVFDYSTLSSLVYIFDAALANGGRPSTFPGTSSEHDFNHQVDLLTERVKSIITSIADTGASHMRRTEAKEALNGLHIRLLYGVRTKPRPKRSVFGGRDGVEFRAEERSAGAMRQFLGRRKKKKKEEKALMGREAKPTAARDLGTLSQRSESEELIRKQLGLGS